MTRSIRLLLAALALSFFTASAALAEGPAAECPYHGGGEKHGAMMGGMHGGCSQGGCSMMGLDADAVKVESLKDGVRITLTAADPKQVLRLQKRAEILRLQHELKDAE